MGQMLVPVVVTLVHHRKEKLHHSWLMGAPMVARATESGPGETAGPGITEAHCDDLAVGLRPTVRSELELFLLQRTVGIDIDVRECKA